MKLYGCLGMDIQTAHGRSLVLFEGRAKCEIVHNFKVVLL